MQARWYNPEISRFLVPDPDRQAAKLAKVAFNVVKKASKNGWNFKKAGKDEIADFVDNVTTLADG